MAALRSFVLACAGLLVLLWVVAPRYAFEGLADYLPLHTFLETVSIVVAALVFGVSWEAYRSERSANAVLMGAGFLAVALLDFGHALSYAGMPDFVTPADPEKAIWFWLAARLAAAVTLLGVALRRDEPLRPPILAPIVLAALLGATAAAYAVVLFRPALLPRMFIEGQGLTAFKVGAEYVLTALFIGAAALFYREAAQDGSRRAALLAAAAAVSGVSELCFTLYSSVTDAFNLLGHLYKVSAYLLIYRAVFVVRVREPFERLAERERRLRECEERYRETHGQLGLVVDNVPAMIAYIDAERRYRYANLRYRLFFGGSPAPIEGRRLEEVLSPENWRVVRPRVEQALAGEAVSYADERRRSDGRVRHVSVSLVPHRDEAARAVRGIHILMLDVTAQHETETALREREAGLRHAQEMAGLAHLVVRPDGSYERWSENWGRLLGLDDAPPPGSTRDSLAFVHPEDRERCRTAIMEAGRSGRRNVLEYRVLRRDGELLHIRQTMEPIGEAPAGARPYWFVTLQDVTEQKRFEERIRRLNRVYAVLSAINAAIVRIRDRQELFEEACRVAVDAGQFRMAWIGVVDRAADRVRPVAWSGAEVRSFLDVAPLAILQTGPGGRGLAGRAVREVAPVVSNDVANDPQRLMKEECAARGINSLAVLPLVVGGEVAGVLALYAAEVGVFVEDEMRLLRELAGDIAFALEHIGKDEQVRYLAYYDPLTGLANRTLFLERLAQHMATADRQGDRLALLILNIERFKTINDTLGRSAGDALLKEFAARLERAAGRAELVARVGADLFGVLIVGFRFDEQLIGRLEKGDVRVKATPFAVAGQDLRISTRSGVAVYPQDAKDPDRLFRNAEAALKRARTGQKYLFYTEEMTGRIAEKLALENELRQALERNEFVLHYQPKIDLVSRRSTGVEALIRWASPTRGLVAPGDFIPLLEETGLVLPVGAWALAQAARDHLAWQRAGLPAPRVAVNVSAIQLRQADFVATVREALALGATPPGIDLEVTESLIMEDVAANIGKLKELYALGVNIAIDDFGTGYSSLGYLARLPVQSLKIDRSFVVGMAGDSDTMSLVSTIVSLARSLRLKVIAEGVETALQESFLRAMRCDEAQGYLYGKPVPAEEIAQQLRRSRR